MHKWRVLLSVFFKLYNYMGHNNLPVPSALVKKSVILNDACPFCAAVRVPETWFFKCAFVVRCLATCGSKYMTVLKDKTIFVSDS